MPFVMVRVRQMFKAGRTCAGGKYTHRPMLLPRTPDSAKDLLWLADRFPMAFADGVREDLYKLAGRYDRAIRAAAAGDTRLSFDLSPLALTMAEPPRPHQVGAINLLADVERLLLGDELGLGKTITAIGSLCEPESRPALIVVPTHLTKQWENQLRRFLPGASTHVIKGRKPYELPPAEVIVTAYTRLQGWEDTLVPRGFRSVIFDEVQDLRHTGTTKRTIARALSKAADRCLGLSATPIYNMGAEIWSVIDVIAPGTLGMQADFVAEWGNMDRVIEPLALNSYLTAHGLMLRRERKDIGVKADPVTREVVTLEGDLEGLRAMKDVARTLAMSVLSNVVGESDEAARQLDWKLRQATGVAKARAVAEFVKQLVQNGEKVLLVGWHREVYDVWRKEFAHMNSVMYTGTESTGQKAEAVKAFVERDADVFILSLRSGIGLDGLQHKCSSVVFGELDWSPQVMEQVIGRLDREGQTRPVTAYFLTIDDGSDPFVLEVLTDKRAQAEGVVEGKTGATVLADNGPKSGRLRAMAEAYLASIGEAIPQAEPQTGLHAEVTAALRRLRLPSSTEREMQDAVADMLPQLVDAEVEREVKVGERARLDFLVRDDRERIAVECKIDQTGRAAVYRQVRRYAEECGVTGVVILAPWGGVSSFVVDEVPVTVVDYTKASLKGRKD